jgi:hypothetical protein
MQHGDSMHKQLLQHIDRVARYQTDACTNLCYQTALAQTYVRCTLSHWYTLQAAVDFRERWAALPQSNIIPEQLGGDAALARADSIEAVAPYVPDLHSLTVTHAQMIYSAATRTVPTVEPGSFAELALAVSIQHQQLLLVSSQQQQQQQQQPQQPEGILAKVDPVAAASRDATSAVLQVAPPLGEVTLDQVRELISAANKAGAVVEPGSYCALAQSAAGLNKRYGTAAAAAAASSEQSGGQVRVRLAHNSVTPRGVYISPNQAKQIMHESAHELEAVQQSSARDEQAPAFTVSTTTAASGQL